MRSATFCVATAVLDLVSNPYIFYTTTSITISQNILTLTPYNIPTDKKQCQNTIFILRIKNSCPHKGFPSGPPPQYSPCLKPLNFGVRMGSGAFGLVWPTAIAYCQNQHIPLQSKNSPSQPKSNTHSQHFNSSLSSHIHLYSRPEGPYI